VTSFGRKTMLYPTQRMLLEAVSVNKCFKLIKSIFDLFSLTRIQYIIKIIRSVHNQFFIYYARLVSSIAYTHFQGSFVEKTEKTAAKPKIQYGNNSIEDSK
jgi:hypothetical protein